MKRKKRIGVVSLLVFLSLSALCLFVYRAMRQEQRNRQLIAAIKQNKSGPARTAAVLACLKHGADPNARDESDPGRISWNRLLTLFGLSKTPAQSAQSALLLAVEGDFKYDMSRNAVRHWSWGDPDIVKILLQYGADTRVRDKHGRAALAAAFSPAPMDNQTYRIAAPWGGRCELLLIEAGADLDDRDENGRTALMAYNISSDRSTYADLGGEPLAEALIRKGAKINAFDRDGKTALIYRAQNGKESDCLLLLNQEATSTMRTLKDIRR